MKLIINIPCYNEARTLPLVLHELPKKIPGIKKIIVQVVDDGSTDETYLVAKKLGCKVIRHKRNLGLGVAFKTGIEAALGEGCDILVNTDADNQYPSRYIASLVKPIIDNKADIVIGNRKPWQISHFSIIKRIFQLIGNALTRKIAGVNVPDTVSGFRAYSKEALLSLNIMTKFSYVLDTIVQASKKGLKIVSISIKTNKPTRKSRLFKNIFQHMRISAANIIRVYTIYEPFKTFLLTSLIFAIPSLILILRFLYFFLFFGHSGKIQSLIIAAILMMLGAIMFSLGVLGDLIGANRRLQEEELYLRKKQLYKK